MIHTILNLLWPAIFITTGWWMKGYHEKSKAEIERIKKEFH
jgi:hypothetical protein